MADRVALINMKGGVGKSTLAVQLAWEMAAAPWHKDVLVIDLDPQFNCSQYMLGVSRMERILDEDNPHPTIWDIFEQFTSVPGKQAGPIDPADSVVAVHTSRSSGTIDLIPSRLELSQSLRNPVGKDQLLKRAVDDLENTYDLVIIDCAPTDSMLTTAAYLTADHILIPVRPEFLSTIGLPLLEKSLENFDTLHPGNKPAVLGLAFNAISGYFPEEVTSKADAQEVARTMGWPVFDEEVVYSKSFPKSAREGRPLRSTPHARRTTKRNFRTFASEFAERLGL